MIRTLRRVLPQPFERDDDGFTLVELLVSMLLFGLVLAVAGMLLLHGLNGQRDVVGTAQASNDAQVSITSMERAIRNSPQGGVRVDAIGPDPNDQISLIVHTGGGDSTSIWRCEAWTYVPPVPPASTGRIFFKRGEAGEKLVPPFAASFNLSVPQGWTLAVDGVKPPDTTIFSPGPVAGSWSIAFESRRINQKESAGVVMQSVVKPRPQAIDTLAGGCF